MTNVYSTMENSPAYDSTMPRDMNPKSSAVAWPAIIAGAVVATVVTLGLTLLGSSLGLASISPWANDGASATGFAVGAAIWMIITQWVSSGLGGYLAGRLRTRWNYTHNDEVFFRDTAHGFLTWSLATLITVGFVASAASSMVGAGTQAAATMGAGAAAMHRPGPDNGRGATGSGPMSMDYYIDTLLRSDQATNGPDAGRDTRQEASRIVMNGVTEGTFSEDDKAYLSRVVARRAGISEADATNRVNNLIAQVDAAKVKAKDAADKARKAAATFAIYTFLSMLIGAFIASVAAALGGRERDYA